MKVPVEQLLLSGQKLNISMEKPQRKNNYDANDGLVVEIMDEKNRRGFRAYLFPPK